MCCPFKVEYGFHRARHSGLGFISDVRLVMHIKLFNSYIAPCLSGVEQRSSERTTAETLRGRKFPHIFTGIIGSSEKGMLANLECILMECIKIIK